MTPKPDDPEETSDSDTVKRESATEFWTRIWAEYEHRREMACAIEQSKLPPYHPSRLVPSPLLKIVNRSTKTVKLAEPAGCPWVPQGTCYSKGILGLHEEIEDFYDFMSPKFSDHQVRLLAVRRLEEVIKTEWPLLTFEVFGSHRTGLYLPTSDIDIVLIGIPGSQDMTTRGAFLIHLVRVLERSGVAKKDTIMTIQNTKVNLIKLTEKLTNVNIDICLEQETGIKAAELVNQSSELFPAIPKLVLILKQFLLQRELNLVFTGGISSYTLILMTWSFLQHAEERDRSENANLGLLLIKLLEFYSRRFNYKNVAIRVRNGGEYIPKETVVHKNGEHTIKPKVNSIISIEDPFEEGNDVANGSFKADVVVHEFYKAFHALSNATIRSIQEDEDETESHRHRRREPRSYLGLIVQISDEALECRRLSDKLYERMKGFRHRSGDGLAFISSSSKPGSSPF